MPVEVGDAAAGEDEGVGVVDGEVVGHARDLAVELAAAEVFGGHDLAGCGFDERRAGQEDVALLLDDDALVAHRGDVGAAGGAGAHDDADLGDAHAGHLGLVVEDAAEVVDVGEDVGLVGEVGAPRVDEVDAWQAVLLGDGLGAEVLLHGDGVVGAALDGGVVGDDHALHAVDGADAGDDAAGGDVFARVHVVAGHLAEFQERRPRIYQRGDAVAHQHLAALHVLLSGLLGAALGNLLVELLQGFGRLVHLALVLHKVLGALVNIGGQDRHLFGMVSMRVRGNASRCLSQLRAGLQV